MLWVWKKVTQVRSDSIASISRDLGGSQRPSFPTQMKTRVSLRPLSFFVTEEEKNGHSFLRWLREVVRFTRQV